MSGVSDVLMKRNLAKRKVVQVRFLSSSKYQPNLVFLFSIHRQSSQTAFSSRDVEGFCFVWSTTAARTQDSAASPFISITAGWQETRQTNTLTHSRESREPQSTLLWKSFKPLSAVSHFILTRRTLSFHPRIPHTHRIANTFGIQYSLNSSPEAKMRLICALMRPVLLGKPLLCCIIVMTKHLLGGWWYPTILGFNCTALGHNIHNVNYKRSKELGYERGKA